MSEPLAEAELHSQMSLAELVNRVLDRGAMVTGEVTISVAGVDLLFVGLQLILAAAETVHRKPAAAPLTR
jgi:gas vesicle structural protein